MLTIAILSLITFVVGTCQGILHMLKEKEVKMYSMTTAIMTISWWDISFPTAIVLLILGIAWGIIAILYYVITKPEK